ncbi:hypothetical protein [Microbacterium sp. 2FI]|uniref:hypothetical protein n=1 Tax=Microbacterium sp. 2FI TaxID=2502193 RepID=UPI0010F92A0D|nr:hypothetical protein [Microbacterium sp. 2FI]
MSWEYLLLFVALPIVIVAVIVATLASRRRAPAGRLTRFESFATSLVGAGAMLAALLSAVSLVSNAVVTFTYDPSIVTDMPYTSGELAPPVLDGSDVVIASGFSSAWIEVAGLPMSSRWLFYIELALPSLATFAISAAVWWLALALLRERPFTRALPNLLGIAAISIMVGGMGSQLAGAFARTSVVEYLGVQQLTGHDGVNPPGGFAYLALNLDASPIGWALSLALVAAAFQIGVRLQRETDLLV